MKWFILIPLAIAFTFFGLGWLATHTARSDDEGIIGGVFYLIGVIIFAADAVILLIVSTIRLLT